jgi:hypothetical protein
MRREPGSALHNNHAENEDEYRYADQREFLNFGHG